MLETPWLRIVVLLCSVAGCGGQSAEHKTREAILRVLKTDKARMKARQDATPSNPTQAQLAAVIAAYCDDLERIDMADCPADFRVAYRSHIRAWREFHGAVAQMPADFLEATFMGFLNSLGGEFDGGASRMEGELKRAGAKIQTTFEEVEKIGAKYGAAL